MIGYKVVRKDTKCKTRFFSATDRGTRIQYFVDKEVKPQEGDGPLAVFHTLFDAKWFCVGDDWVIYKCEYVPSRFRQLWYCIKEEKYTNDYVPFGTIFADYVTLLEEYNDQYWF